MKLDNLTFKREALTLPVNGHDETWDYLTIYSNDGLVAARSTHHHPEGEINLEHEGYSIIAPPTSRNRGEENIYITIKSIKDKIEEAKR